ncbi:TlyA family RNA methyltransferase [Ruminococcaceae bacterium OttesenSCG-928-O06]|nr:TlyA family RNA methyltransferase [Ruminococcaceae bacterium OttesenSCG-928-O06]
MRLDQYLLEQNLVPSRERGRALIMAGQVYVNDVKAEKAGQAVPPDARVELRGADIPYVSRGGLKLEKALQVFGASPAGCICMDAGASTGGFTDCMLQNGAAKVYAVDVGYGQLAWKLRNDARVVVMERTNIRTLDLAAIPEAIGFFTVDVSFISLKLVLPVLAELTPAGAEGVCLVKPQFEAGRDKVGKNGVIRDANVHQDVLQKCAIYANDAGFDVLNIDFSPITGPKGNMEFLLHVRRAKQGEAPLPLEDTLAQQVVAAAHNTL